MLRRSLAAFHSPRLLLLTTSTPPLSAPAYNARLSSLFSSHTATRRTLSAALRGSPLSLSCFSTYSESSSIENKDTKPRRRVNNGSSPPPSSSSSSPSSSSSSPSSSSSSSSPSSSSATIAASIRKGACAIPHPSKVRKGEKGVVKKTHGHAGEDAFCMIDLNDGGDVIGAADGVAAWAKQGIDAGEFSRALLGHVASSLSSADFPGGVDGASLVSSLSASFDKLRADRVEGSCTVCLASFAPPTASSATGTAAIMHAANLGDSGLIVLRGVIAEARAQEAAAQALQKKIYGPGVAQASVLDLVSDAGDLHELTAFQSYPQEKEFGCPFQLGHHPSSNSPAESAVSSFALKAGDIVVLGTDGLFDNVSEDEIATILVKLIKEDVSRAKNATYLAQQVAFAAFEASRDKSRTTPYSLAATEEFGIIFQGGKPDDITCVLVVLEE